MVEEVKNPSGAQGQGQTGRRGQNDRWGDIYTNMPLRRMVALYDYDPQVLSPNVDAEVNKNTVITNIIYTTHFIFYFFSLIYKIVIVFLLIFKFVILFLSKLNYVFKLEMKYMFMVKWMMMVFTWVNWMVYVDLYRVIF